MRRYNPSEIEPKWQRVWDETGVYTADLKSDKPKYIAMSMFNYPSGAGIHIGHAMNYTISDVKARYKRQQGYESYHPIGWDAFGLPAENYAIKTKVSPQESMAQIIPMYHKQYKAMGWSNDWEKEIATHQPEYYKWTQWIFLKMYEHGLAYQAERMQWWCPIDKTVLANEQVIDGKCWRHDGPDDPPAERKEIKQWFFKITDYADELLEAVDSLDWSDSVKLAQKNWIGKSIGAEIDFKLDESEASIKVFTTRPDTIFGATFIVLAPEHEILNKLSISDEVKDYIKKAEAKTELERQENKEKTGVAIENVKAINPANGQKLPVYVADYVLPGYGTGAIMAVPGHDSRDYEFAKKHGLPVKFVIEPTFGEAQGGDVQSEKIFVALLNPAKDKVLVLDWGPRRKNYGGHMLIGGSVEDGEEHQAAAEREIAEETGYKNFKLVKEAEFKGHGYFYSNTKDINVHASGKGLMYELIDEEKEETNLDHGEKDKFTTSWEPISKVAAMLDDGVHEAMYRYLVLDEPYDGEGILINSGKYDGMSTSEARDKIIADLESAQEMTNYRMRDWSVGRQRYWGAPIPIIHCEKCGMVPVPEKDLPVILPELDDFEPAGDGRSALARAKDWLITDCSKCGGPAERETDTMDTYVDSGWYMYRYFDPHNQQEIFDKEVVRKWEPIDFYNGADHATAHLLYARLIGHFFKKIGLVDEPEPFKHFLFNGKVTAHDGTMFSKSKGNGVDPLEIIDSGYGADALRTYLMFAAPLEQWARWDPQGVPGAYRFLNRVWNLVEEFAEAPEGEYDDERTSAVFRPIHRMIKKVTEDLEDNRYNTAIAAMMECTNELYKLKNENFANNGVWKMALESLVACMAPFAPHISEELWHRLGHSDTIHKDSWPAYEEKYLASPTITLAVQVNGKVRSEIVVAADISEEDAIAAAKADAKVAPQLAGKPVKKAIYVPGRLVSLVV